MTTALDHNIAARCDLARAVSDLDRDALALLAPLVDRLDAGAFVALLFSAMSYGVSLGPALASMVRRVHTGYLPPEQRRAMAHRSYSSGLARPPRRETAADRVRAEAVLLGMVAA